MVMRLARQKRVSRDEGREIPRGARLRRACSERRVFDVQGSSDQWNDGNSVCENKQTNLGAEPAAYGFE